MDENILSIVTLLVQCETDGASSFMHIKNRARKG